MKRIMAILCAAGLCFGLAGVAAAGDSDGIVVNYEVQAINEIVIADDSVTLTVSAATAGSAPTAATDSSSYAITTNCADNGKKITAALGTADMAAGLTLSLTAAAPTGASSSKQDISNSFTTAVDVVTLIDGVNESSLALDFELVATAAVGVVASANQTVTLTIVNS